MKRVFIETFGCQMNKLDSELSIGLLLDSGYEMAKDAEEADVILFNTRSVRKHAEDRVYSRIGALKSRKIKDPELALTVCNTVLSNGQFLTRHILLCIFFS